MKRTLEEAIKYYSELAEENEKDAEQFKRLRATQDIVSHCYECANEHRQLAEWLRELKAYRDKDMMLIYANPLAEAVRCAMCTNPMRSNSGCDGGCKVDEQMYRSVMDAVNELIMEVKADANSD